MAVNTDRPQKYLNERAKQREEMPTQARETAALEGIQDELTQLNAAMARIAAALEGHR